MTSQFHQASMRITYILNIMALINHNYLLKMTKIGKEQSLSNATASKADQFIILYDFRTIQLARYKRKLRKQKRQKNSHQVYHQTRVLEAQRNQVLNLNMLGQQNIWNQLLCQPYMQPKRQPQNNRQIQKKVDSLRMAKRFVARLNIKEKKYIFREQFGPIVENLQIIA